MARYPTKPDIRELFSHLASKDPSPFWARVSPNVTWDVMESFQKGALGAINKVLSEPLQFKVVNVIGGGDEPWAVAQLEADATCKNGMAYNQRYAWVMRFDESGTIVEVKAYLDSALVQNAIDANS